MAKWSDEHVSARPQPTRYDENGRPLAPVVPKRPLPTLPGSIVQYSGDDPLEVSGLRGLLDTPEARQQQPEAQAALLREYQAAADRRALRFDLDEAERYWFDNETLGHTPKERTPR